MLVEWDSDDEGVKRQCKGQYPSSEKMRCALKNLCRFEGPLPDGVDSIVRLLPRNILSADPKDLLWSVKNGHLKLTMLLLDAGADIHINEGLVLGVAAEGGYLEIVKLLVESGANVHNGYDYALRWASSKGHLEIVKFLVDAGSDVKSNGDVSLRWAAEEGHLDVVKFLVGAGADIHACKDLARRLAEDNGQGDVVKFLEQRALESDST